MQLLASKPLLGDFVDLLAEIIHHVLHLAREHALKLHCDHHHDQEDQNVLRGCLTELIVCAEFTAPSAQSSHSGKKILHTGIFLSLH